MITAATLVGAVRGRRLCYEIAQRSPACVDLHSAMFDEAHRVHEERGDYARGNVVIRWAVAADDAAPGGAPTLARLRAPTLVEAPRR